MRDTLQGLERPLVVLKTSHPFGPVVQRPLVSKPYLPDGPVQKGAVDRPVVPVKADTPHFVAAGKIFRGTIVYRRFVFGERPDVVPKTICKKWYPVRRLVIDISVIVFRFLQRTPGSRNIKSTRTPFVEKVVFLRQIRHKNRQNGIFFAWSDIGLSLAGKKCLHAAGSMLRCFLMD